MLSRRLASAAVLIAGMILLIRVDFWIGTPEIWGRPGIILSLLAALVAMLCGIEFHRMWHGQNTQSALTMAAAATTMSLIAATPVLWRDYPVDCPIGKFGWSIAGVIAAMLLSFAVELVGFNRRDDSKIDDNQPGENHQHDLAAQNGSAIDRPGDVAGRIGRTVFMAVYLSMLFGFFVPLRLIQQSNSMGLIAIICLIATVKMSDAFAYFAGKSFGTKKLAPRISPGKTIQGTVAAPVGGTIAAAIVIYAVSPLVFGITIDRPWWWIIVYGFLVTLAGIVGDLAESLLKRDAACKDSGSMLPGLGGILDVLDSLIFAAPISYLMWIAH